MTPRERLSNVKKRLDHGANVVLENSDTPGIEPQRTTTSDC